MPYKWPRSWNIRQVIKRTRRDYFSEIPLQHGAHRDYFSAPTPTWSSSRLLLRAIAPASSSSRSYLRAIMPVWASRRCYFPPSKRLPLGVSSPAVVSTLSSSWPHPRSRTWATSSCSSLPRPREGQQIAVEPASRIPHEELPPTIIIV